LPSRAKNKDADLAETHPKPTAMTKGSTSGGKKISSEKPAFLRILVNCAEAPEQMEKAIRNDGVGPTPPDVGSNF
jgi:hypothetical protein